jgi:hypothetical protein
MAVTAARRWEAALQQVNKGVSGNAPQLSKLHARNFTREAKTTDKLFARAG